MIRIDLGKDGLQNLRGRSKNKLLQRLPLPSKFKSRLVLDLSFFSLLGIAVIVAFLPQPFLKQFKIAVTKNHQSKMTEFQAQLKAYEREIANLTPFKAELASYEQQKKAVADRLGIVQNLLAIRTTPVSVLDAIGQSLPKKAWLEEIRVKFTARDLTLKGLAYTNEQISDYMDKLSESVYLNEVKLVEVTTRRLSNNVDVRNFEVGARARTGRD
ncbi:MAG: PilN domain-containing protein [Bdellovibrionota bacterium]